MRKLVFPAALVLCASALAFAGPTKKPKVLAAPPALDADLLWRVRDHLIARGYEEQEKDGTAEVCLDDELPSHPQTIQACLEASEVRVADPVRPAVLRYDIGDLTITIENGEGVTWILSISPSNQLDNAVRLEKGVGVQSLSPASPQVRDFVRSSIQKILGLPLIEA